MKVSFTYLSHNFNVSGVVSKSISSKYFMYIFVITGSNDEPIAKPPSCSSELCRQHLYVNIVLSIEMLILSPKEGLEPSHFRTIDRETSVGTMINSLTISNFTI